VERVLPLCLLVREMSDKIKGQSERRAGEGPALIFASSAKSCINSNRFKIKPAANV
jgi:hypothetical protein